MENGKPSTRGPDPEFEPVLFINRGWTRLAAATATGVALGFLFLFPQLRFLIWIALVPFLLLVRKREETNNFALGFLVGFFWFLVSCHWERHVTWAGWWALSMVEGVWLGIWTILLGRFHIRWRILAFPLLWVSCELLRSKGPLGFSWNLLGHLAAPFEPLAQSWGVFGLSFLVAAVNSLAAVLLLVFLRRWSPAPMPEGAGTMIALPVIWLGIGLFVYWRSDPPVPDHEIEVGVVQGNFNQSLKWSVPQEALERYVGLTDRIMEQAQPDLIIWPEVAIPAYLSESPGVFRTLQRKTKEWRTSLLFGVLDRDHRRRQTELPIYNSAVLIRSDQESLDSFPANPIEISSYIRGSQIETGKSFVLPMADASFQPFRSNVYDKARLLPFGEYVPFKSLLPFVNKFVENRGGGAFSSGRPGKVLDSWFGDIGPLICFESAHPGLARRAVLNGATLLVNITNDAWFLETAAADQHALQSRFRSIETGLPVVRAANTGISALFLPDGTVRNRLPVWEESAAVWKVSIYHQRLTFHTRVGDFLGWLCLVGLFFSLLLTREKRQSNLNADYSTTSSEVAS